MLLKRISGTNWGRWNTQSRSLRNTHKEVQVNDPVEYQIIKQKQSMNNHSIKSYSTICHSASFSSLVSITMMKNKLYNLENNQSTKQVSITMQDSRIIACNNLPSTQSTNYRAKNTFLPVHPSGTSSEYTSTTRF